ncbi:TPA: hypothetical protein RQO23_003695 [Klebsiella oxytoca]|uniref:hypothetical protein n=1 Tax=Klebsiella oxytoca TaxID=571 RepID=UPI001CCCD6A9|nr:hypothetical protein [Klebsiella oxytoca]MBZ7706787.1 hypothetical protein [Klebsiella oxytoca]HDX8961121.1 hypothetical protein [Klebsiella oxytoca]HDX9160904.1 hypothetical protein [Klebsiella oxytoca]
MDWTVFWSATSAVFTGLTVLIAGWAMLRWRKQEELKAKLNFKMAVANYAFQLTQMPEKLDQAHIRHAQVDNCQQLTRFLSACNNAWMICEGLLNKNEIVHGAWRYLFENNKSYIKGELTKSELGESCMVILNEKFVFD